MKRLAQATALLVVLCPVVALVILGITLLPGQNVKHLLWLVLGLALSTFLFMLLRNALNAWQHRLLYRHTQSSLHHHHREGSILVIILIITGLLAALVLHGLLAARSTVRLNDSRRERALLRAAASDVARQALKRLADDPDLNVDHAGEDWAQPIDLTQPSGISIRVVLTDAQSKFDLNNLIAQPAEGARTPRDILVDLMNACGHFTPLDRIEALEDWIDEDLDGLYEADRYEAQDLSVRPPNSPLQSLAECVDILKWSPDDFEARPSNIKHDLFGGALKEQVTVLPGTRVSPVPVNVNTVTPLVLRSVLGWDEEDVVQYIRHARAEQPIRSLSIMEHLRSGLYQKAGPWLSVRSSWFELHAMACRNTQCVSLYALVHRNTKGQVDIIRWIWS